MRCSAYTAYTPPRGRVRLSKNLAEDVRDRAAGGVCGGQKAHRAFNQQAFETFLNVSKAAQRGENTFSTRWACGNRRRPRADHRSAPRRGAHGASVPRSGWRLPCGMIRPHFALGDDGLYCIVYAVGWVFVLFQKALDQAAHPGAGALPPLPVDGAVFPQEIR